MAKRTFKSKRKLTGGKCTYRAWKEWEVGDYIIGTYRGSKIDNYDKPNWLIEIEDASFSDSKLAKKLIGQTLGLNSAGQLNKAMEKVEESAMVQVMYNGTSEIENGKYAGKDAHLIEVVLVEVDSGDEEAEDEEDDSDDL